MSVKSRRSYNSPQREEQAQATQRRILAAAMELFATRGYPAITMAEIARQAGVSLPTVYLYYPGKAAIVGALADEVTAASDLSVEQVEGEPDPVAQLRTGARIIRTLNERAWLVAEILRSARGSDEGLTAIWETWQRRHLDANRRAAQALAAQHALRPGLTVDEATDILYTLTSTDVYRSLVTERDWSPDQYEQWLIRVARNELIDAEPQSSSRSRSD